MFLNFYAEQFKVISKFQDVDKHTKRRFGRKKIRKVSTLDLKRNKTGMGTKK